MIRDILLYTSSMLYFFFNLYYAIKDSRIYGFSLVNFIVCVVAYIPMILFIEFQNDMEDDTD